MGTEESIRTTPNPVKNAKQSAEGPEAKVQPSLPTPATEEDSYPKVLIRGKSRKVPDAYPKDVSGQLDCNQRFINELAKQLVAELLLAC